jgi:16S rRNA (cytosine967-C5)-methyltransferase
VLVDVACSNTGVLRHRVDVKWRLRPVDLKKLPRLQQNILRNVANLVKPGGRLVYSTCSLETEENEGVVNSFIEGSENAFTLESSTISRPWETGFDGAGTFLLRRAK